MVPHIRTPALRPPLGITKQLACVVLAALFGALPVRSLVLAAKDQEYQEAFASCDAVATVDVTFATDVDTVDVAGALLQSAMLSSHHPECLRFHAVVPKASTESLLDAFRGMLAFNSLIGRDDLEGRRSGPMNVAAWWRLKQGAFLRVVTFDSTTLEATIKVVGSSSQDNKVCRGLEGCDPSRAARLRKATNFARFYLASILPELDKVIWMDCDVIVRKDLQILWEASFPKNSTSPDVFLAAFVEHVPLGRFYFSEQTVKSLWRTRYLSQLDTSAVSFNDGVIVIDLQKWRHFKIGEEVAWWMQQHKAATPALWKFGTQPIMLLLGNGKWQQLPSRQYMGDLGFRRAEEMGDGLLEDAVVLHFNGEHKPWLPVVVSEENAKDHGVVAGWNHHLLRPYVPASAPFDWIAAPGARCLTSSSRAAANIPCDIGPVVPGVSVPALQWVPARLQSNTSDGCGAADVPDLFQTSLIQSLSDVNGTIEGFFSAAPLVTPSAGALGSCSFSAAGEHSSIELFFPRARQVFGAYLQAASSTHALRAARLQYKSTGACGRWQDACEVRERAECDPRRGPSFPTGRSVACWRISSCTSSAAQHWRVTGWELRESEPDQKFGGMWLSMAPTASHSS